MNRARRTGAVRGALTLLQHSYAARSIVNLRHAARRTPQPVTDRIPGLAFRYVLNEDAYAARLVERAQVRIKIARKALGAASRIDPGDVLVRAQRQALRQNGDTPAAGGLRIGLRIDLPEIGRAHV